MKKTASILMLLLCFQHTYAQNMVEFTVSRPFCLLNFMETMSGNRNTSSTLRQYIQQHIPATDTTFQKLVEDYSSLVLDYSYPRQEFPQNRRSYMRSTEDLIKIAAVQARTIPHFRMRIAGILPNSEQTKLCDILTRAEPYYDKIITAEHISKTKRQLQKLNEYEPAASKAFRVVRNFYTASWADDMPFTVSVFPIPGSHGSSIASAHANSLALSVFTDEKNYNQLAGIVVHEMCHVLYDEQPVEIQQYQDSLFQANRSPYMQSAYNFFDEGLATALGNGWIYKQMTGTEDSNSWYANEYIDGFAHALYPIVSRYMNSGRSIDKAFIDSAIYLFGTTFPRSLTDYGIMMNRVFIYANIENEKEREQLYNTIGQYFQLTYANLSAPILDKTSIEYIQTNKATQLFVIDRGHAATMIELKKQFPELSGMMKGRGDKNYILNFFDKRRRPIIIIHAENTGMFDKAFAALHTRKYLDEQQPYQVIK